MEKKINKAVVVSPKKEYTHDQVRGFLGLKKSSSVCPSKYGMSVKNGKVQGASIIKYLEGRCRSSKIGRRYASGSVTVVAR